MVELVIHASYTPGTGRIKVQPGCTNFLATYKAISVLAFPYAPQCTVDFLQLCLPPACRFYCHLLGLQGVHARQAANLRLVECHGASGFCTIVIQLLNIIPEGDQPLLKRV